MNRHEHRYSAYSLIELIVAMTAGSAVMMLAIGLVHQSMSLSTLTRDRSEHQKISSRLVSQFRMDVGRADHCLLETPQTLRLEGHESVIVYAIDPVGVTRSEPLDDKQTRSETFHLADNCDATFETDDAGPLRAVLTLSISSQVDRTPRVERRVEAVVGRLSRLEQSPFPNSEVAP